MWRALLCTLCWFLQLAATILLLITTLSGFTETGPLSNLFWLKATHNGVVYKWSSLRLCEDGICSSRYIVYPFSPANQFITGVSQTLIDHASRHFYLTRVGLSLIIASTILNFVSSLTSLTTACCLGGITSSVRVGIHSLTLFTTTAAAAIVTAGYVLGYTDIKKSDDATIGVTCFVLLWLSFLLQLLSMAFTLGTRDIARRQVIVQTVAPKA